MLEVPAGLETEAFDSPAIQTRFHALLDQVITPHLGRIAYLSIGNEVDVYLRAHPAQWAAYQRFFEDAAQYARSLDPALKVGVTGTADGAVTFSPVEMQSLNATSDVIMLTYYPVDFDVGNQFTVRDPTVVSGDVTNMLAFAGAKPLVFQEAGYPASTINFSSQTRQGAFVRQLFAAWSRAARTDSVPEFFPSARFHADHVRRLRRVLPIGDVAELQRLPVHPGPAARRRHPPRGLGHPPDRSPAGQPAIAAGRTRGATRSGSPATTPAPTRVLSSPTS